MDTVDAVTAWMAEWRQVRRDPLPLDQLRVWSAELATPIHLAVMVEPYLSKICSGEKFIESRLTRVNIAPYRCADSGDVILFKRSGGPISAVASVDQTRFEEFGPQRSPAALAEAFAFGLGYEPGYVESKAEARFASLLWLSHVSPTVAVPVAKSGRQAWVTILPTSFGPPSMLEPTQRLF